MPVALIGAGGIGKTSIALTVLHDNRIKQRFGVNRRFIRCDKFPASLSHFLRRLSNVIGAGIENPEDLAHLRPFLSSKEMLIVLDNAESILDPHGTDAQEIYDAVEELSQLSNIGLFITSRLSTIPPGCEWVDVPTLSMEAACDTFYRIYPHDERSALTSNILEQLEFHPLSVTLLATVAHHSKWDTARLASEWGDRRTDMLQTDHKKSLATTIELSLSSRMFQALGPTARDLLGVIAFFPQGVDEKNIDWLFSAIQGRKNIFDKFCVLSLTYRSDGFITMLAPLREHLRPKDPEASLLLLSTRDRYFGRLSVDVEPDVPGFGDSRWIISEDVNVEHLLDVFTTIDVGSVRLWTTCAHFMDHLRWHKPQLTVLGPKIEALPDDHPSKPRCLLQLSRLFDRVGNDAERKRVLTHTSKLCREREDDWLLTQILMNLSDANRMLGLCQEGIQQAEEALKICDRLDDTTRRVWCLNKLAWLLYEDKQLDAAEDAASRAIDLLEKDDQFLANDLHGVLGEIYHSKGEREKAIHHFEAALAVSSSFNNHNALFWNNYSLASLFFDEGSFDDANVHIERAKSHAVNDAFCLGRAMGFQAKCWYKQDRLKEAKAEALRALDVHERLGAVKHVEAARQLLREIETAMNDSESPKWCYFRHVLTFYFQFREWNESIDKTPRSCRTSPISLPFPHLPPLHAAAPRPHFSRPDSSSGSYPVSFMTSPQTHVHRTNIIIIHSRAAKVTKGHFGLARTVRTIL